MKKIATGVGLGKKQLAFVSEARTYLDLANRSIYVWCDLLGYELRDSDYRDQDVKALFIKTSKKTIIAVNHKISYREKIRCISHEIFHDKFHPECIAFRVLTDSQIQKDEGQCELFASLILFPDLSEFETEADFFRESGLPQETAEIRINYFRKTGT